MAGKKKLDKDKSWVGEMEGYSRQIWLAGLGAYAKMGKEGAKLFETLIRDGEEAEKAARSEIDKQVDVLKARVGKAKADADPVETAKAKVDKSRGKLLGRWGELESVFDKRLNTAISRLGVPSRDEIKELEDKVDALSRSVLELIKGKRPPAKVAPKAKPNAVAGGVVAQTSPRVLEESLSEDRGKPEASPRRRAAGSAATAAGNAASKKSTTAKPRASAKASKPAGDGAAKRKPTASAKSGAEADSTSDTTGA